METDPLFFTQTFSGHLFVVVVFDDDDLFDLSILLILKIFHIVIDGACGRMKLLKKRVEIWSRSCHLGMVIIA